MTNRHYRHHSSGPTSSRLLASLMGFPLALFGLMIENPGGFLREPLTALAALLLAGGLLSGLLYLLIAAMRGEIKQRTAREDWHAAVGKPKKGQD